MAATEIIAVKPLRRTMHLERSANERRKENELLCYLYLLVKIG